MFNLEASRQNALILGNTQIGSLQHISDVKSQGRYGIIKNPIGISNNSGTPHGINDILNRPTTLSASAPLGSLGPLSHFPIGVSSGVYFGASNNGLHKISISDLPGRSTVYWPNPEIWRDRFSTQSMSSCLDKDGKKKHTRPTFSGHQIYVLEKTFEQTKYLAGPERAKLAYALGMSESQVKVWFQNRRTKWRKKHAAEMATAKKKHDTEAEQLNQEEVSDQEDLDKSLDEEFASICRQEDSSESVNSN